MTLEQFLRDNIAKGVIDFQLRASTNTHNATGTVTFYIHAEGHDSDTLDFFVEGDRLGPLSKVPVPERKADSITPYYSDDY